MPHTLLSLNYDVLENILQLVSPHDAAQLALVSRAAYAIAFPRFLSDISLGGLYYKPSSSAVSQLKTFCNFVLAPAPCWHGVPTARLDGLRSLEVMRDAVRVRKDGVRTVDSSAVALLSSALERAHNLQKLILWGSDALFAAYPDFGASSSASIHTLVLGGDIAPLPALARAFPHVRTLEFVAGGGSCVPDWAFAAPDAHAGALSPWRKTLERVDAGFPVVPLACPVRRVDLRNPIVPEDDSVITTNTFLAGTRPVVLSASLSTLFQPEQIGQVLHAAAPALRFLDLVGDRCESLRDGFDWMMHNVVHGLALIPNLSLLGISLAATPTVVSASSVKQQSAAADAPSQPPIDIVALARAVAESVPSLRFVEIDLSATEGDRAWFHVQEVGVGLNSTRRVEKMSEGDGVATAAKMRRFDRFD